MEKYTSEIQIYFNSLPANIQESILQSGARFDTKDQMEQFVQAMEKKK